MTPPASDRLEHDDRRDTENRTKLIVITTILTGVAATWGVIWTLILNPIMQRLDSIDACVRDMRESQPLRYVLKEDYLRDQANVLTELGQIKGLLLYTKGDSRAPERRIP
jgi:hypothetical protein